MKTSGRHAEKLLATSQGGRTQAATSAAPDEETPPSDSQGEQTRMLDAMKRLTAFSERHDDGSPASDSAEAEAPFPPPTKPRMDGNLGLRRGAKSLVALVLAVTLGWVPLQRLLETTSTEAVVNARLITLRAPIDGEVASLQATGAGIAVQPGDQLLRVVNPRADHSHVASLKRMDADLDAELAALDQRLAQLEVLKGDLKAQRDAFQRGRVLQLEARIAEFSAQVASAEAQREEARLALDRARTLNAAGFQSESALDRAEREARVTSAAAEAARERLSGARVELDGARQGLFIGDSYNDIPRSAQRLDEIGQQIIEAGAARSERTMRKASLAVALAEEEKRLADRTSASITAPVAGHVWEVLTAPGEQVHRGQDVMRVLDCGGTVVTAAVTEAVYNRLSLGAPASFQLRADSHEYTGRIVGLNGLAKASANLAIEQKALAREPYHVTVEVTDLARTSSCSVGRTGKVTFDSATSRGWLPFSALWP